LEPEFEPDEAGTGFVVRAFVVTGALGAGVLEVAGFVVTGALGAGVLEVAGFVVTGALGVDGGEAAAVM